jgi:hypothetical protein
MFWFTFCYKLFHNLIPLPLGGGRDGVGVILSKENKYSNALKNKVMLTLPLIPSPQGRGPEQGENGL